MKKTRTWMAAAVATAAGLCAGSAYADTCKQLSAAGLNYASLQSALRAVSASIAATDTAMPAPP